MDNSRPADRPTKSNDQTAPDAIVDLVIATGCPYSGWEIAASSMKRAGLNPVYGKLDYWHDCVVSDAGGADPIDIRQPLSSDGEMGEKIQSILDKIPGRRVIFDSRSVWLLDFWASQYPGARFLLFYVPLEDALANALLQDLEPSRFLDGWEANNRHLTAFHNRNLERSIVINAVTAARNPRSFVDACNCVGLTLHQSNRPPEGEAALPALERLMARLLMERAESSIGELLTELETLSRALTDSQTTEGTKTGSANERPNGDLSNDGNVTTSDHPDLHDLMREAQQSFRALATAKCAADQEVKLLRVQIRQDHDELPYFFLKSQELQREITNRLNEPLRRKLMRPFRAIASSAYKQIEIRAHRKLLKTSGYFDETWYLSEYEDVAQSGIDPVLHYLKHGATEGRNPSPFFETRFYLDTYRDVDVAGMNPLVHFVKFGRAEGRMASHR